MDKLEHYRALLIHLLTDLARLINAPHASPDGEALVHCVFDTTRDHYLWLQVGWAGKRRICATRLYVRLHHGKFWIEDDMTEEGIATDLVRAGVPKEDIVLAFQPPDVRQFTEFATA